MTIDLRAQYEKLNPKPAATATSNQSLQPQAPKPTGGPLMDPGANFYNPGYTEQAFNYTQNQWLNDPFAKQQQAQVSAYGSPTTGEQYMNQNLGTLNGPGTGEQYWNQVAGQYMNPFAGEQYARQATADFAAQGPASAFYNQAMGQYGAQTGFNTQNAQGQYGASSGALAGGSQGEQGLGAIAGQYGTQGQYGDPNRAAGQYAQTQQAFGDLPIANFDPFYDRARQLATQDYNRQAAGRGVYGSSEALSGVGNVITDIEAQRANRSFDAELQRAQEQRARQQLLGEQARMGDVSGTEAFAANLRGAETFAGINNQLATQELGRHELLGNMASNADTQATAANNSRTNAISAFGTIANAADTAETDRYRTSTAAMAEADRNQLARQNAGMEGAFKSQDAARQDFTASQNAASQANAATLSRMGQADAVMQNLSQNRQGRLRDFMNAANGAEAARMARHLQSLGQAAQLSGAMSNLVSQGLDQALSGDEAAMENWFNSQLAPELQRAGMSQADQNDFLDNLQQIASIYATTKGAGGFGEGGAFSSGGGDALNAGALDPNPY